MKPFNLEKASKEETNQAIISIIKFQLRHSNKTPEEMTKLAKL